MYYYLNEHKQVQGPFTAAEIRRMLVEGAIAVDTPASAEGGDGWKPLGELELKEDSLPAVPAHEASELGECPHCGIMLRGREVPPACPHCDKALHPGTSNPWKNAWYVCKQILNYRGRATRKEYWCFILFCILVEYGMEMLQRSMSEASQEVGTSFQCLLTLGLVLACLSATVRRLHDVGRSGWWAALPAASWLAILPGALLVDNCSESTLEAVAMAIVIIGFFSHLYILVLMLRDSEPGPNGHGPSLLYPHG